MNVIGNLSSKNTNAYIPMRPNLTKTLVPALLFCMLPQANADELTNAEREKLSKRLEELLHKSQETLTQRQATAYKAYKQAIQSETAAMELYLNCVELADFENQGKKSSDFRDWKRNQKDRYSDPSFKCALRHQLNWLVLTIEAARSEEDINKLGPKARQALQNIFKDASKLKGQENILRQGASSSVFARAYGFGAMKVENWPSSPLAISEIYEKLIFPPLRDAGKASLLRSAWLERLNYEEQALLEWAHVPKDKSIGMKKDMLPPAYEKYMAEKKPKLVWKMEKEVFQAGDEAGAATRMLTHISKFISHNDATKWAEELQSMIAPQKAASTEVAPDKSKNKSGYIELPVE